MPAMLRPRFRRAGPLACALLITAFGAFLRLDAFVQKYGPLQHPAWARVLTHRVAPLAVHVRPAFFTWRPEQRPYLGGDPINYLRYAREMTSFYQPHVREPIFLALTRASLWLLGDQDEGLSLASAIGSVLTILGVYLLGATVRSPAVGLGAALIVAIEFVLITWAPDGWRDDTFTAAVVLSAWAFLRFRRTASFADALLLGGMAGAACLTRITALSFVVPALAWLMIDCPPAERRARLRVTALATLISAAIVLPYLISCAVATGDPLYAINYHTRYYRYGEGLPSDRPMSAGEYVRSKLSSRPFATADTAATGIFVQPFRTKWNGIDPWIPGLAAVLRGCSLAGLLMLLFSPGGRLMLVILFTSIVPYALTWNIAGGGEWRFTMHAYPFFIVAAFYAIEGAWQVVVALWRNRGRVMPAALPWLRPAALVLAVAANLTAAYLLLPWFVAREAIARGDDVSIETGGRDFAFYGSGWSTPHLESITVRVSRAERAIVQIPLPSRRAYDIVLRVDPVAPERQDRVTLLLNRHLLGSIHLTWNPERVGSYRVRLPAQHVVVGSNELALIPDTMVPASSAGTRFAWLDARDRLGIRLWYVRVLGQ
jgi:4-amino-4-deoxy-L-arabinose transferase-like glycosyltransferase